MPTAILPGSSRDSMGAFSLWFQEGEKGTLHQTGIPKARTFVLTMPPLQINGKTYRMENVSFEAYAAWGVYTCVQ